MENAGFPGTSIISVSDLVKDISQNIGKKHQRRKKHHARRDELSGGIGQGVMHHSEFTKAVLSSPSEKAHQLLGISFVYKSWLGEKEREPFITVHTSLQNPPKTSHGEIHSIRWKVVKNDVSARGASGSTNGNVSDVYTASVDLDTLGLYRKSKGKYEIPLDTSFLFQIYAKQQSSEGKWRHRRAGSSRFLLADILSLPMKEPTSTSPTYHIYSARKHKENAQISAWAKLSADKISSGADRHVSDDIEFPIAPVSRYHGNMMKKHFTREYASLRIGDTQDTQDTQDTTSNKALLGPSGVVVQELKDQALIFNLSEYRATTKGKIYAWVDQSDKLLSRMYFSDPHPYDVVPGNMKNLAFLMNSAIQQNMAPFEKGLCKLGKYNGMKAISEELPHVQAPFFNNAVLRLPGQMYFMDHSQQDSWNEEVYSKIARTVLHRHRISPEEFQEMAKPYPSGSKASDYDTYKSNKAAAVMGEACMLISTSLTYIGDFSYVTEGKEEEEDEDGVSSNIDDSAEQPHYYASESAMAHSKVIDVDHRKWFSDETEDEGEGHESSDGDWGSDWEASAIKAPVGNTIGAEKPVAPVDKDWDPANVSCGERDTGYKHRCENCGTVIESSIVSSVSKWFSKGFEGWKHSGAGHHPDQKRISVEDFGSLKISLCGDCEDLAKAGLDTFNAFSNGTWKDPVLCSMKAFVNANYMAMGKLTSVTSRKLSEAPSGSHAQDSDDKNEYGAMRINSTSDRSASKGAHMCAVFMPKWWMHEFALRCNKSKAPLVAPVGQELKLPDGYSHGGVKDVAEINFPVVIGEGTGKLRGLACAADAYHKDAKSKKEAALSAMVYDDGEARLQTGKSIRDIVEEGSGTAKKILSITEPFDIFKRQKQHTDDPDARLTKFYRAGSSYFPMLPRRYQPTWNSPFARDCKMPQAYHEIFYGKDSSLNIGDEINRPLTEMAEAFTPKSWRILRPVQLGLRPVAEDLGSDDDDIELVSPFIKGTQANGPKEFMHGVNMVDLVHKRDYVGVTLGTHEPKQVMEAMASIARHLPAPGVLEAPDLEEIEQSKTIEEEVNQALRLNVNEGGLASRNRKAFEDDMELERGTTMKILTSTWVDPKMRRVLESAGPMKLYSMWKETQDLDMGQVIQASMDMGKNEYVLGAVASVENPAARISSVRIDVLVDTRGAVSTIDPSYRWADGRAV